MDKIQLKQRIVGAVVLVALGVIFIPMILNQGDDSTSITGTNIPQKPHALVELEDKTVPEIPTEPVISTDKPEVVDELTPPLEQVDSSPGKKTEPVKTKSTKPSQATTESEPKTGPSRSRQRAWVVQVASFAERDKALKLRDRLRQKSHPTFVESVKAKSGLRYRVRVGPVVNRSKAEQIQKQIAKQFRIKDSLVMRHP